MAVAQNRLCSSFAPSVSDRFIANRMSIYSFNDKYYDISPNKNNNNHNNEYRKLLKNELFKFSSSSPIKNSAIKNNENYDNKYYYEIDEENKKYYQYNSGASPIKDKDKLSKTPKSISNTPSNNNGHIERRNYLDFDENEKNKFQDNNHQFISATPIKIKTQLKILNLNINKKNDNNNNYDNNNNNKLLKPYFTLNAPQIIDDFYSSILDWNHSSNLIAVGLKYNLFIYDPINKLFIKKVNNNNNNRSIITSVKFNPFGEFVSFGTNLGKLSIYDLNKNKYIYSSSSSSSLNMEQEHIGSMEWTKHWNNSCILFGSKLNNIINIYDLRINNNLNKKNKLIIPTKCVNIKFSPDLNKFAIGGRDRCISIYDIRFLKNRIFKLKYHSSSIRAISWSLYNYNILLSGGGSLDKKLCIWNLNLNNNNNNYNNNTITINKPIKYIRTKSQICEILWSSFNQYQILTTHGYDTNNINIWNIKKKIKINTSISTNKRLLYVAINKNKQNIVTASSDDTLRFWNVFNLNNTKINNTTTRRNNYNCNIR